MKERPILFSAPMVRAILEGQKTQTRRIYKNRKHPDFGCDMAGCELVREQQHVIDRICPYGQTGDRLWVREAWQGDKHDFDAGIMPLYRATDERTEAGWRPSIHMPRWASRILLEIVAVRVERLAYISREDAEAEGVGLQRVSETDYRWIDYNHNDEGHTFGDPRHSFWSLWKSINGEKSHDANPWVWVVEFKKLGVGGTAVTREMIGAAHDIMLARGDFVLSAALLEKIYLAMEAKKP
jgi:hypothetical protein